MLVTDSLGRLVRKFNPSTIISLVPSWTEFLADIGVEDRIIGRTKYCILPASIQKVEEIGGTKNPDVQRIIELSPDLVIANKEENKQYDINRLRSYGIEVFVSYAITIEQTLFEIKTLEWLHTGETEIYKNILGTLKETNRHYNFDFLYLIWKDPVMAAGRTTYISNILEYMGGNNSIKDPYARYPTIDLDNYSNKSPDVVFLPDEPYKFTKVDKDEIEEIFPSSKVILLDGKILSWYGKRLADVPNLISNIIS